MTEIPPNFMCHTLPPHEKACLYVLMSLSCVYKIFMYTCANPVGTHHIMTYINTYFHVMTQVNTQYKQ